MSGESTRWSWSLVPILCCLVAIVFVSTGHATTITLGTTQSGWYDQTGFHNNNPNYIAGVCCGNGEHRDFFVFDLLGVTGKVVGATLRLFNPFGGYVSPDATETYTLFSVATPTSTLIAGGSGLTGIFDDLANGAMYGSRVVSAADNNTVVEIVLNANAVNDINALLGLSFAVGGTITTLQGTAPFSSFAPQETIFVLTGDGNRQLMLTIVPEPAALLLFITGLIMLCAGAFLRFLSGRASS
jgi:hypothetical protein